MSCRCIYLVHWQRHVAFTISYDVVRNKNFHRATCRSFYCHIIGHQFTQYSVNILASQGCGFSISYVTGVLQFHFASKWNIMLFSLCYNISSRKCVQQMQSVPWIMYCAWTADGVTGPGSDFSFSRLKSRCVNHCRIVYLGNTFSNNNQSARLVCWKRIYLSIYIYIYSISTTVCVSFLLFYPSYKFVNT